MAFLGIEIPIEISEELSKIKVPGKKEDPAYLHVTMFYLGDKVKPEEVAKAMVAAYSIIKNTEPFKIKGRTVTSFPEGKYGFPIIIEIESDELISLRKKIKNKFEKEKIEFSNRFPDYRPHLTLSYSPKEVEEFNIKPISCKVESIVVWGGDDAKEGINIYLPLKGVKKVATLELESELFLKFASK